MQTILDALVVLNGKFIERMTWEETRKQLTPADAVMAVFTRWGKICDGKRLYGASPLLTVTFPVMPDSSWRAFIRHRAPIVLLRS